MSEREQYGGGSERNQTPSIAPTSNMNLTFSADGANAVYKPIMPITSDDPFHHVQSISAHHHEMLMLGGGDVSVGVGVGVGVGVDGLNVNNAAPIKRKRGRPRKYSPPHGHFGLNLTSPLSQLHHNNYHDPHQSPLLHHSEFQSPLSPSSTAKKARGRPPGSGRKNQLAALGTFDQLLWFLLYDDVIISIGEMM